MSTIRVATWNVNAIRARLRNFVQWVPKADYPDFICLQELRCPTEHFPINTISSLGYNSYIFGQKRVNGVAILSKQPVEFHENISITE